MMTVYGSSCWVDVERTPYSSFVVIVKPRKDRSQFIYRNDNARSTNTNKLCLRQPWIGEDTLEHVCPP